MQFFSKKKNKMKRFLVILTMVFLVLPNGSNLLAQSAKNSAKDITMKKNWKTSEKPVFNYTQKQSFWINARKFFSASFVKNKMEVILIEPASQEEKKLKEGEDYNISGVFSGKKVEINPEILQKVGRYELKIKEKIGEEETTFTQDFTWGVLAINTNKSIYLPNEEAKMSLAVLDGKGAMVCDAKVKLEIKNPQAKITELSTENGKIKVNPECHLKKFTLVSDYETQYQVGEVGEYQMTLTAENQNGTFSIEDNFSVQKKVAFDVERITATRIYPVEKYPVTFNITANKDFQGEIIETVPKSFEIKNSDVENLSEISNLKVQISNQAQNPDDQNKKNIIWDVDIKKGETFSLSYKYDAPDISPEFYLLGQLKFVKKSKIPFASEKAVFQETRQWQIAADDIPTYQMQTGAYVGNGSITTIKGLGFAPELVIIKADTAGGTGAIFKTTSMLKQSMSWMNGVATADDANGIINLESDGFKVSGTSYSAINNRYTWQAFAGSDCSATGRFCVGTYYGNGTSPRAITTGFQTDLVWVKAATTGNAANWRSVSMPNNYAQFFGATAQDTAGAYFTTLDATGFTVGATNNASAVLYHYVAFKETAGSVDVGTYTGTTADSRNITGVGFVPDYLFIKNANHSTPRSAVSSNTESYGDSTSYFTDTANLVNSIQALQTDGFQLGNEANFTANGDAGLYTYYYAAFSGASDTRTSSGTFKMATGTYTGTGGTYITINNLDFQPDLIIVKGNTTVGGVFRTSAMGGDYTAYLDSATADFAAGIVSLDAKGFTIGSSAVVNTNAVNYYWTAYGNAWNPKTNSGAADFTVGAYYGNGIDNRDITRLPFQPDLVTVKRSGASGGVFSTSSHSAGYSSFFTATNEALNMVQAFNSDGFEVGNGANVNTAANNNWFFAFKTSSNFTIGNYAGNSSAYQDINTTFQPDNIWVKRSGATSNIRAVERIASMPTDSAFPFINVGIVTGDITQINANGFRVGAAGTDTNITGSNYWYLVWGDNYTAGGPSYQMQTGAYVGNGSITTIEGLGFAPELVIIKADTAGGTGAIFKTTSMLKQSMSWMNGVATADDANGIINLESDGFKVSGTSYSAINNRYTWQAFAGSDCSATGRFCVGTYYGNGTSPRAITTGFQTDLVWVKAATTGNAANWRSVSMPNNYAQFFGATAQDTAGAYFTTLDATGFTVGATNNASAVLYHYVAFKETAGSVDVGTYTGTTADSRNITGVGFVPDYLFIKNANHSTPRSAVSSNTESYGDSTSYFTDTANLVNSIQALQTDGFQLGNEANFTANGDAGLYTYYYAAFSGASDTRTSSGTFKMATGTYTGTGGTYITINNLDFQPDLIIVKGNTTVGGVFRTSAMGGDYTAYLDSATADFAAGIVSLDAKGFTIGSSAVVNTNAVNYYWTAYGNAWNPKTNSGAADFTVGAYYGNGIDNRDITRLPFQPDLVTVKRSGASGGVFSTSSHSAGYSSFFTATNEALNMVQAFNSDGFEVGNGANVNTAANNNWFFAFKTSSNFTIGNYAGNSSAYQDINTTFQPDNIWVKRSGATSNIRAVERIASMPTDSAFPFINVGIVTGDITQINANGFRVGAAGTDTNITGSNYWYLVWKNPTLALGITISGNIYTAAAGEATVDTTAYSIYISVNNTTPVAATVPGDGTYTWSAVTAASGNSVAVYIYNNTNDAVAYSVTDGVTNITGLNLIVGKITIGNNDSIGTTTYNSDICAQSSYPTSSTPDDSLLSCSMNNITAESGVEWHILQNKNFDTNTSATLTTQGSGGNLHIDDGGSATFSSTGTIGGDATIDVGSTLAIASTNTLDVGGSWTNVGTFTANSSLINFNSNLTGEIIDSGGTGTGKDFYDVVFNSSAGGWTIGTSDMKVAHNLTITDVSSWELDTSRNLEVDGTYSIADAETSATTWDTGSNFYLNGTSQTIGSKTQAEETYATLQIGANTDVRMWNSSAGAYTVDSSGSLYSMDHDNNNGDLYIWGDYHTLANDYWNHATDFDGTSLSGSERQVDVRIDPAANVTVDSGDTLAAIGAASANRTLVSRQGTSNGYGLIVDGGTINFQYADLEFLDGDKGLDIRAGSTVTSLDYCKFNNLVSAGVADAFVTVASTVIGSAQKTLTGVQFDDIGGGAEFNVNRTGSDDSGYWNFSSSTGDFDGEDYDGDDGVNEADPGMLRWVSVDTAGHRSVYDGTINFEGAVDFQ
jgi:hypothetical protein